MAKALTKLIAEVRSRIDEPIEDYFKDSEIVGWLNEALNDMAMELRTEDIFETEVADTKYVELPEGLVNIRSVFVDGQTYQLGVLEDRNKQGNLCYIWNNRLYFSKKVSGNVELFYIREPRRLVEQTDVLDMPARFSHLPVIYAYARCKEKDEEAAVAFAILDEYRQLKYEMVQELKQKVMLEGNYFLEPYPSDNKGWI